MCVNRNKARQSPFFKTDAYIFAAQHVWWSCSGFIFYQDQKNLEKKKCPLSQEILLIFCSIPSKKIGNPTLPSLILPSAQTILTPTEN